MSAIGSTRHGSEKSHVSMEQHVCPVCGKTFDTGAILLDKRLRKSLEHTTLTGNSLCPDDQEKYDAGYIALVGCDPSKTTVINGRVEPGNAYRTGNVAHLRREVWQRVFNVPLPRMGGKPLAYCFVDDA